VKRASSIGDPIARFRGWFAAAERSGEAMPEAMVVATCTRRGQPSARFVLLKQVDARGFVFFTDGRSRKGQELRRNPLAAAAVYWDRTGRQVRLEGRVEVVPESESDAYWETRPRPSRLAAASSHQSATLASRRHLLDAVRRLRRSLRGRGVPRPGTWQGYRIVPQRIEFWSRRAHRLHERELFVKGRDGWKRRLLQP
jgi:pyridoxamine 5'-phosphate oxidase